MAVVPHGVIQLGSLNKVSSLILVNNLTVLVHGIACAYFLILLSVIAMKMLRF